MSRPKRIDLPYSLYHVISRSISSEIIFNDFRDQNKFFEYLSSYADLYGLRMHAWCFMPTHFHLLVESGKKPTLSPFMHRLLTAYTVWFNRRHNRHGHLFQGRFKSLIIDKANYLLAVSRYIHLNPTQIKRSHIPENYKGSSFYYYVNGGEPDYLYTKEILNWFQGDRKKYARFVNDGLDEEIKLEILKQRYIGGEAFAKRVARRMNLSISNTPGKTPNSLHDTTASSEEETNARKWLRLVAEYFKLSEETILNRAYARGDTNRARTVMISLLRENLPWAINRIAQFLNMKQSSGIYAHLKKIQKDSSLHKICETIKKNKTE